MEHVSTQGVGVAHGRFQVLHNDHLRYLLAAKQRCRHLVVGITNPEPELTRHHPADPGRSTARANPLTYYERYILVRAALGEAGVAEAAFSVVPFPINLPERLAAYIPAAAVHFITIYDAWGQQKYDTLQALGVPVEVLWRVEPGAKGISGTEVRQRMAAGEPWRHLVPAAVVELLDAWQVPQRLRQAAVGGDEGRSRP